MHRKIWSWGALLGVVTLATSAMVVDSDTVDVRFAQGDDFDIMVAGSLEPGWTPHPASWGHGNPDAYDVVLGADPGSGARPGGPQVIGPGGQLTFRVAALNTSPGLPARVALTVTDPDDRSGATDPATGRPVELFSQLRFTIVEDGEVLVDDLDGPALAAATHEWTESWAPDEMHLLEVTVALPADLDNQWQDATSAIQLRFEAQND
ncbi:hypothetical protein ASE27_17935 [Oerskovia sp. Root918]|uniref:hypothetical protein n=1 Tax=Oerskovia sp. Root918 TaxID=1736607 RepID=UPI0006FAD284|nr:hypothetical protein [Oerskovia sp. Root918]KRD42713.1 hypothetical protein ASE27_17935 [Oerskovia sp. Root918]